VKLAIVGGGAMGESIVAAVLREKLVEATDIVVAEPVPARLHQVQSTYGVNGADDAAAVANSASVLLAVKPQDFDKLAASLKGKLPKTATVISIMAGITIDRLRDGLGHGAIVRSIPNTPAQVGEGFTLWTATPEVTEAAQGEVAAIFQAMGRQEYVGDERYIDMATGVSGSGPAFVFLFIEAFADAAVYVGFGRELATEMALQTILGSAKLAQASGKHPAELRAMVTSPGGTTAEGLRALEEGGLRAAVLNAVDAAYNKSKLLGGGMGQK
jgi:pyrroline-5-carboxylate reductase